jgi:hypothetical protein
MGQTWPKKKLDRDQPNKNAHNLTLGWTQPSCMDQADDPARTGSNQPKYNYPVTVTG